MLGWLPWMFRILEIKVTWIFLLIITARYPHTFIISRCFLIISPWDIIFFIWCCISLHITCLDLFKALKLKFLLEFNSPNTGPAVSYLGCTVSTGCLPAAALEFRLLTDFLGLWHSWPGCSTRAGVSPSSLSASLRSVLILLMVNRTFGCSSPQANQIFAIRELGERTLETCLTRKIKWT